ncbi:MULTISPECIES: ABC transporter ATP-binding protein [unclassified Pseudomonas]|uniref:ABC transporter ATP-binding protein n=1 Tax=unclassified Pseudomonas TaxID=196821 RepID=UPI00244928B8|nr:MULTISPECIES: ABC transporter ATP-binding protein [unclassified Pseudomonas]MDH0303285.1 ABC transporter ATP-binding protein/permease [Pseudomonas sp. GD04091]MDH1985309.1 ABC transporter ATP-binding protein/permease [Pseudomonas sp. GD03689]
MSLLGPELQALLRPFRGRLWLAVAVQAVAGLGSLLPLIALAQLADSLYQAPPLAPSTLGWVLLAVFGAALWLCGQTSALHLTHGVDADLCDRLRVRLAEHLQRLPLGWFTRLGADGVSRYAEQDVRALHQLIGHAPTDLVNLLLVPLAVFVYLLCSDSALALWCLLPLVLGALGYWRLGSAHYREDVEQRNVAVQQLFGDYGQFAANLRLVRQFPQAGAQQSLQRAVAQFDRRFSHWVSRAGHLAALIQVLLSAPWLLAWVLIGASLPGLSGVAGAQLCAFLLLVRAMAAPVLAMGHGLDALNAARASAGRLQAVLSTPPLAEPEAPQVPRDASVELRKVNFAHGSQSVLSAIDLRLEPGTITALVGPSGSGKSTLAGLIARFMDVDSGQVLVGGVDVRQIASCQLQRQLALVLQRPGALRLSLAQNIALYRPEASLAQIREVARAACLDSRIMALPKGYASIAGDDVQLCGGELQRLAIARALLSSAPVMLLDEPTSAIDPQTELSLRAALRDGAAGRTRLIIAHRLRTICHAEQILVLDQGRIVQRGGHQALLAVDGLYRQLWREQMSSADRLEPVS